MAIGLFAFTFISTFIMKKILFTVLTIGLLLYGCGRYLNYKVNFAIINLAEKLSLQIGHEVKIANVSSRWDWLYLKINVM